MRCFARARWLAAGALAAVIAAAAAAASPRPAPAVSGPELFTGRTVSLQRFAGRPVVVALWASWCGGCVDEAPVLVRFHRRHPHVGFLGVDNDILRSQGRYFARTHRLPGPSIFDPTKARSRLLGASTLPTTFFLDRRHRIVSTVVGTLTTAQLERGLARARRR